MPATAKGQDEDVVDQVQQWLTLAGIVVTLLVAFVGALVFVRGSYNKAKQERLRTDNSDLRDRVDDLESSLEYERNERQREKAEHEHQLREMATKLDSALTQNQMLAEMILQRANVEAIQDQVEQHHKEAKQAWSELIPVATAIRDMLQETHRTVVGMADGKAEE